MVSLRSKLPPLNSLATFEAAARHLNFTHAAKELNVTQAAVSRQIHVLEDFLGISLFDRLHRALELTRDGKRLQQAVTLGLEHISTAVEEIQRTKNNDEITVATSVTFASYWLMSRVAKFHALYPKIELRLVASAPVENLAAAGIDLAFRYGAGKWSNADSIHLFNNEIFPVCSPAYLAAHPELKNRNDLVNQELLHLSVFDRNWLTWDQWFEALGIKERPKERGLRIDNYMILIQAALSGQGIALCGGRLADDFLERGDLVRPVKAALWSERAFYVIRPRHIALSRSAELFQDWVLAEAHSGGTAPAD